MLGGATASKGDPRPSSPHKLMQHLKEIAAMDMTSRLGGSSYPSAQYHHHSLEGGNSGFFSGPDLACRRFRDHAVLAIQSPRARSARTPSRSSEVRPVHNSAAEKSGCPETPRYSDHRASATRTSNVEKTLTLQDGKPGDAP